MRQLKKNSLKKNVLYVSKFKSFSSLYFVSFSLELQSHLYHLQELIGMKMVYVVILDVWFQIDKLKIACVLKFMIKGLKCLPRKPKPVE